MRVPKFRKQHKAFPLTRFQAHLDRVGLSPSTKLNYVAAVRRMLAAVGTSAENREAWRDTDAVDAYFSGLPRRAVSDLQAAFTHWLSFNDDLGAHNLSVRAQRAALANALCLFLDPRHQGKGGPVFTLTAVPCFSWDKLENLWALRHANKQWSNGPVVIPPLLRPPADLIRAWGRSVVGSPFLPEQPGSNVPMTYARVLALTDNRTPDTVTEPMNRALNAAKERLKEKNTKTDASPQVIEIGVGTKIVDGELVVDRTNPDVKMYEDFKLPDE